jgi:phenylpropionate dioxygenase-like ring-hydroxylating dioxygenase large terminal subunit
MMSNAEVWKLLPTYTSVSASSFSNSILRQERSPLIDDAYLRQEWLAVGWSASVATGALKAVRLLGRDVLLWRDDKGIHAWEDLCIHRGAKLSLGMVRGGCVVCPYHHWEYDASGKCVFIPSQPEQAPPLKARANVFHAREKYGLIWVALETPRGEIPFFPEGDDPAFRKVMAGPYAFRAKGPRIIENFLDVAHLPFVHAGLLGDPARARIEDYEVETTADGVLATDIKIWQPDPDGTGQSAQVRYNYRVERPLTASFQKLQEGRCFAMLDTVTPVDEEESLAWVVLALNYSSEEETSDEELRSFQDRVSLQDKAIVESQRPELLPLDLAAELHLRSDRMAIGYRRWLKELGLEYGTA